MRMLSIQRYHKHDKNEYGSIAVYNSTLLTLSMGRIPDKEWISRVGTRKMTPTLIIIGLFAVAVSTVLCANGPHVKISNGELEGSFLESRDGKTYLAFRGIPYAKEPKRFKLAEPAEPWEGILDATKFGNVCVQILGMQQTLGGSEDCLFLNVFTHKLDAKLPVMVYIHGGAFMTGSSNDYGASYFMDEDVVFVNLNYRLAAFGFLSTGDGEVEPNLALKDQNLALKWVQKNIHAFGGDPKRVTIFGTSAGSTSVHYHVLSPMSKGLFQQASLHSGTALNVWSFSEKPEIFAFKLGKTIGCQTENSKVLIKCLEGKSAEEIINAYSSLVEWHRDPLAPFCPSLDIAGKSEQMFVPDTPTNILASGKFNKVPLIFTATEDEGLLFHAYTVNASEKLTKEINEEWERVLPITLMYEYQDYSESEQKRISKEVKKFYFGDKEIGASTFQELTNMYSDRFFIHGIEKALTAHAKHSTVYNGIFAYRAQVSLISLMYGLPKSIGVSHGDDLFFFFGEFYKFPTNTKDEMASKYFVSLLANFAKTGNPGLRWANLRWNATSGEETQGINWMNLDLPPRILENPFGERVKFWDAVLNTKGRKDEL